jgi:hypothetical protein
MTPRRRSPAGPAELARRRAAERARQADPAAWGLNREALALGANAAVSLRCDAAGRPVRARRQDIFELMAARGRLSDQALAAVRRLQDDLAALHATALGGRGFAPRVDCSLNPQGFTEARRRAGERIAAALGLCGAASARLLAATTEPGAVAGRDLDWRAAVERTTGERLADAQGALLRMACENLAGAYAELDRRRRAVAARDHGVTP